MVRIALPKDAARVAEIYNQGIEERSSTFETRTRTEAEMAQKIGDDRHPVLVSELEGRIVGWASIGTYRPRDCYSGVGEFSIYLDRNFRRRGLGRELLTQLIEAAAARGYWKLLSRVFPENEASLALCRACGFREVGVYQKHSRLDGRWMDVVIVETLIEKNLA